MVKKNHDDKKQVRFQKNAIKQIKEKMHTINLILPHSTAAMLKNFLQYDLCLLEV